MTTLYQPGDSIKGELIVFQCRDFKLYKKSVAATHAHRAQTGKLEYALCTINRRFRHIPERSDST